MEFAASAANALGNPNSSSSPLKPLKPLKPPKPLKPAKQDSKGYEIMSPDSLLGGIGDAGRDTASSVGHGNHYKSTQPLMTYASQHADPTATQSVIENTGSVAVEYEVPVTSAAQAKVPGRGFSNQAANDLGRSISNTSTPYKKSQMITSLSFSKCAKKNTWI